MRIVIQRVAQASVTVDGKVVGAIQKGALVLLGVHKNDDFSKIPWLAQKLIHLRMFHNAEGKMDHSLLDLKADVLIISQFTLYGNCAQGRRPDFFDAAPPALALPIYEQFIAEVRKHIGHVATGIFGADMQVSLVNDGPVTLIIDTQEKEEKK